MPRPGWDVFVTDAPVPPQIPVDTGVWFVVGGTAIGPANKPVLVQSLDAYTSTFGARTGGAALYDAADVFFREGGTKLWVSAIPTTPSALAFGAAAVEEEPSADEEELMALTREELNAKAVEAGVENPEALPNKQAVVDAILAPTPLVVTTAQLQAALALFTDSYGPGQVSCPGNIDPTMNASLMQHALDHNRVALIESPPGSTSSSLLSFAAAMRTNNGNRFSAMFAPLAVVPGVTSGTTRTVGWTAVVAGCCARNDARGLGPNVPAAGVNGASSYALDVELRYTDTEYTNLNNGSVNMAQYRYGALETYGFRTLVDPTQVPEWWSLGFARLQMAIQADAGAIAERYVFALIDGRGTLIAEFGGDLRAMLVPYWESGQLYGDTADDAFQVNVGPAVNTPATIANGELHATLMVRMSPFAEYVQINIVKVSTQQALVAA